jgi:hypothetical protein
MIGRRSLTILALDGDRLAYARRTKSEPDAASARLQSADLAAFLTKLPAARAVLDLAGDFRGDAARASISADAPRPRLRGKWHIVRQTTTRRTSRSTGA